MLLFFPLMLFLNGVTYTPENTVTTQDEQNTHCQRLLLNYIMIYDTFFYNSKSTTDILGSLKHIH